MTPLRIRKQQFEAGEFYSSVALLADSMTPKGRENGKFVDFPF
jgi:hypothetical protein